MRKEIKYLDPESWSFREEESKETDLKTQYNFIVKNKDKEKYLKSSKRETTCYTQ